MSKYWNNYNNKIPSASSPAADTLGSEPGALSGGSHQERDVIASLQIVGAAVDKARAAESRREADAAYLVSLARGRAPPGPSPTTQNLADALVALNLPVPRFVDEDLREALLALGTVNERLKRFGAGPRETSDRENGWAAPAPTGPVQGRPGTGNAGTAPAPKAPHAKAPKDPHVKAPKGSRAKRRRLKARNNAQQQARTDAQQRPEQTEQARTDAQQRAEQAELGATTPNAPVGPTGSPATNTRGNQVSTPAAHIKAPAAGGETSNITPAPSEAVHADESAGPRGCRGCNKPLHVPFGLQRRNERRGWVPHAWCRPCKINNDAHYARENTARATPTASNPEFLTASPAAPATPDGEAPPANAAHDGETSPANAAAPGDELQAISPATPVTSAVTSPEMNWLQAAKGSLRQAEH